MIPTPLELVQAKLDELIRARNKSAKALEKGTIAISIHERHIMNLTPKIESYRFAIKMLQQYAE